MVWRWVAAGVAGLVVAMAALPAAAQPLDLNNLPPWPLDRFPPEGIPSRLDTAPPAQVVAAADGGYLEGHLVLLRRMRARDPAVVAWAREESAKGNAAAFVVLGRIHTAADEPSPADLAEAARAFRAAAELGDAHGMRELGVLYAEGQGVTKDAAEAIRWWTRSAQAGDTGAMIHLLEVYSHGTLAPKDPVEAKRWKDMLLARDSKIFAPPPPLVHDGPVDMARVLPAAEAGDLLAMRTLGKAYLTALGVRQDKAQALRWFGEAAARGDHESMRQMSRLFEFGWGVPQDKARSLDWLRKAAEAGNRTAMYGLHVAYARGEGVEADPEAAKMWLYRYFWAPDLP